MGKYTEEEKKLIRKLRKKLIISKLPALAIFITAIVMCFVWYDWKLLAILMVFNWGNNLGNGK